MKAKITVRMNRTTKGAPDSITVKEYLEGHEYDVPEDLAECFFSDGSADPAEAHAGGSETEPAGGDNSAGGEDTQPAEKPVTRKRARRAPPSDSAA